MPIYEGLGRTARFRIVVVAAIIATANLAMGWYLCVDFQKQFYFTDADAKLVEDVTLEVRGSNSDPNATRLAIRMLDNLSHLKAIVNKQSVLVLAISSGFALFAIGFALFPIRFARASAHSAWPISSSPHVGPGLSAGAGASSAGEIGSGGSKAKVPVEK
jgi:hypothetical protein